MRWSSCKNRGRAFTLIELLVVLGVVGLLLALLLPALARVRAAGWRVTCAAGLREQSNALLARSCDADGRMPLAGTIRVSAGTSGYGSLPPALGDADRSLYVYVDERQSRITPTREQVAPLPAALLLYLDAGDVEISQGTLFGWEKVRDANRPVGLFACPAAPEPANSGQTTVTAVGNFAFVFGWDVRYDYGLNEGVLGHVPERDFEPIRLRGHLMRVTDAANTLLLADAHTDARRGSLMAWSPRVVDAPNTLADVLPRFDGADDDPLGPALDADRHDGRMNVLFADGHIVPHATADADDLLLFAGSRR